MQYQGRLFKGARNLQKSAPPQPPEFGTGSPQVGGAIQDLQIIFLEQKLIFFPFLILSSYLSQTCPSNSGGGVLESENFLSKRQ